MDVAMVGEAEMSIDVVDNIYQTCCDRHTSR